MTVTITMSDTSAVYIGGAWQAAAGPDRIAVRNPVTERVIAEIPVATATATAADVDVACLAAVDALGRRGPTYRPPSVPWRIGRSPRVWMRAPTTWPTW
jgi:hypothetical protein